QDSVRQRAVWGAGKKFFAIAFRRRENRRCDFAEKEGIDQRDAYFERVRHRRPIDVPEELVPQQERGLHRRDAREARSRIGSDRAANRIEQVQALQTFAGHVFTNDGRNFVRQKKSSLHQIRAFIRRAVLQRICGLGTESRRVPGHAAVDSPEGGGGERRVLERSEHANDARNDPERFIAAEQLVAAGAGERYFPSQLRRRFADEVRIEAIERWLVHRRKRPRQFGAELLARQRG